MLAKLIKKKWRKAPPKDPSFDLDVKLDHSIVLIQVLKALGEMLPFPYIKGTADLALKVLEPIRLARTNRQDFEGLVQDINSILLQIRDLSLELSSSGTTSAPALEAKCMKFTKILSDILIDLALIRRDIVDGSKATMTTPAMQQLIKSFQNRLQIEVQAFQVTTILEIHSSVQITNEAVSQLQQVTGTIASQLVSVSASGVPGYPHLENYVQLRMGELKILREAGRSSGASEYRVTYNGDKTLKVFKGNNAEETWAEEIMFYHELQFKPRLRQLFGFTKTFDRLGLVFHDHGVPLAEYWEMLPPLERMINTGKFIADWNHLLMDLNERPALKSASSAVNDKVWPYFWTPGDLAIESQVLPMVNGQGLLAAALSREQRNQAFRHHGTTTSISDIESLQTALTHKDHNKTINDPARIVAQLAHDLARRHNFTFVEAHPRMALESLLCVMTNGSPHDPLRPRFASYVSIPHPSAQEIKLRDWTLYGDGYVQESHDGPTYSSFCVMNIPDGETRTYHAQSSEPQISLSGTSLLQYLPDVIKSLPRTMRDEELHCAYENYIGLYFTVQISFFAPRLQHYYPYLFLRRSVPILSNGELDFAALYYVSFDSDGRTEASLKQIAQAGYRFTFGKIMLHCQENSIDLPQINALCSAAEIWDGFAQVPSTESWQHVRSSADRSHSLDRSYRPPQRPEIIYNHIHWKDFWLVGPPHSPLCDLINVNECICGVLESHYRCTIAVPEESSLYHKRCQQCKGLPKLVKQRRSQSLDRFDRLHRSVSRWIRFMEVTGMDPHDLRFYYLESPSVPQWGYYTSGFAVVGAGNGMPRRSRYDISPWTQLVYPEDEERGRIRR
ncbi:hypothetical protein DL96DRAFT_1622978 [Flagelloscypha sp. PMI_526]|nr:hypothetical protein DL96DRAFT_1622978 [Flagelloscypha sp. PMI_526]